MARPTTARIEGRSELREALALKALEHAGNWPLAATLERADAVAGAARSGRPLLLDAPTLHRAMFAADDGRSREFRYDRVDQNAARRWLLTEDDDLIGPLTPDQLVSTEGARQ